MIETWMKRCQQLKQSLGSLHILNNHVMKYCHGFAFKFRSLHFRWNRDSLSLSVRIPGFPKPIEDIQWSAQSRTQSLRDLSQGLGNGVGGRDFWADNRQL